MSDLISRQAAIDAMNAKLEDIKLRWKGKVKKGEIAMYLDMRGTIETLPSAQPTVDAEPVRHGKWDKGTDSNWHICEECGAEVDISMGTGVWVEGVELYELKYCPYCGAKMDERKEE